MIVFFQSLYRHRSLLWQLICREIQARYRGTILGMIWSLITPVFMLGVYTFVFSVVFKAKWGASDSSVDFAQYLFCGLVVYALFAECVGRASALFVAQPNYITKILFPLEILVGVVLGSGLFNAAISSVVLFAFIGATKFVLPVTVFFFPLTLVPLAIAICACVLCLATFGVYLRDMNQVVSIVLTILMFLSPIFYPLEAVPDAFRPFLLINPLAPIIDAARRTVIMGLQPDWIQLAWYTGGALMALHVAWWFYGKVRKGFADVV